MWGFVSQQWRLTPGEAILVDLVFDGHNPLHVYAQAITPVFVKIDVPPTSELYNTFRHSRVQPASTTESRNPPSQIAAGDLQRESVMG